MKKSLKIAFTTIFLSVISFIGISNAKALTYTNYTYNGFDVPDPASICDDASYACGANIFMFFRTSDNRWTAFVSGKNSYNVAQNFYGGYGSPVAGNLTTLWPKYTSGNLNYRSISQDGGGCFSKMEITNGTWTKFATSCNQTELFGQYTDLVYNSSPLYYGNMNNIAVNTGFHNVADRLPFSTDIEQGEVILGNSGGVINNLVSFYLEHNNSLLNVNEHYKFYYTISTGGGARESVRFYMKYKEGGILYNNNIYHYYYNLPMSYNANITFNVYDEEDNLLKSDSVNAYLSSLTSLSSYDMYDFTNYNVANMSYVNNDKFGVSKQLTGNIKVNVVNYSTGIKSNFFNSSYYSSSYTDSAQITWYEFDFNNEPLYLEIINEMANIVDLPTLLNSWDLFLYFSSDAYVHLSTYPKDLDTQSFQTNQQAYKDSGGTINYVNNNIIYTITNSGDFFGTLQKYFSDIDNFDSGLTGIITSPLNLIQNLLTPACTDLSIPLPYINSTLTLPCMSSIYSQYFGSFYTLYQNITFGIIAYWVIVRTLRLVKDFRSPDHDEIEVLDL